MVPSKLINRKKKYDPSKNCQNLVPSFWSPKKSPDFVPPSWGCRCFFARRCPMKKIITLVETKDAKLVTVSCLICFWWNGHVQFLYNSGAHYDYDVPFDFLICQTWTILNDWWLDNSRKISEMHFKSSLKASWQLWCHPRMTQSLQEIGDLVEYDLRKPFLALYEGQNELYTLSHG